MRMSRIVLLALLTVLGPVLAHAETRVALVIGNSRYQYVPVLPNPANDAVAVAAALKRIGFSNVQVARDLNANDLRAALQAFGRTAQSADMAAVFYFGHGIEVGGTNYLIPVDAKLESDRDVDFEAISLDIVLRAVEGARGLKLVVLDACRTNPFAVQMKRMEGSGRDIGRGLARVEPAAGHLVVYAARDGSTAGDGTGSNSPFTSALVREMGTPGLEVTLMFRKVRDDVLKQTNGLQEPYQYGSLSGDPIYFVPPQTESVLPALDPRVMELAYWNSVSSSGDAIEFQSYLRKYPNGEFADLARAKIAMLNRAGNPIDESRPIIGSAGPLLTPDQPEPIPTLADLYASPEAWTAEYARVKSITDSLDKYRGSLGSSAEAMLTALDAISGVEKADARLLAYAGLKADEDVRVAANQERQRLAAALATRLGEKTSWAAPEILSLGSVRTRAFEQQTPELARRFDFFLNNTLRNAAHTLSASDEAGFVSQRGDLNEPINAYGTLTNDPLLSPTLTLSDGTSVHLDQSGYINYRQSPSRADRKLVFDTYWRAWKVDEDKLGSPLARQVALEVADARAHHFSSSLAAAVFPDNIPEAVYRQLIAQANAGLPTMYRYLNLRKKLLGITGDLAYYDIYPTMFKLNEPPRFTVADSERISLAVVAAYGSEYVAKLQQGFAGHWMDVLPRAGKASGGYMQGAAYDVHPYLHLNHRYDYQSLSTFVHEWGHAVHTMLTHDAQPFENSNYSTFIAETASITNEMLLNDYMVAHANNDAEKLYYLGEALELMRGTFFRQTMFAEFQLALHEEAEQGHTLSGKRMSEIYCNLLKKYHGAAQGVMTIDPAYCVEWAFVPHFYYGFYVWQYATSMAGAAVFADGIEREGQPARARFLAMLKAGGSDYPYEIYKRAGLDMASPAPYKALLDRMEHTMDQIDALQSHATAARQ